MVTLTQSRKLNTPPSTVSQAHSQYRQDSTKRISTLLARSTRSKSMPQLRSANPYLYKPENIYYNPRPIDGGGESAIFIGSSRLICGEFVVKQLACVDVVDEKKHIKTSDYIQIKTREECEMEKDLWIKLTEAKAKNILGFYGYFYTQKIFCFLFTKENQSLLTYIYDHNTPSWQRRYRLMIEITEGIVDIHKNGIIHGDIKVGNILVNAKMQHAKICDLGSAHEETNGKPKPFTVEYAANELFENKDAATTKSSDIFSLAVTFWQIAAWQRKPYNDLPRVAIGLGVQDGIRLPLPKNTPTKITNLITLGWSQAPSARPTAAQVLDGLNQIQEDELTEIDENKYRLCLDQLAKKFETVSPKM